jgi:hypothetical protein
MEEPKLIREAWGGSLEGGGQGQIVRPGSMGISDLRRKCNMSEIPESGQALATTMESFVIRRVIRVVARREATLRDPDESSAEERRVVDGHDGCHCS